MTTAPTTLNFKVTRAGLAALFNAGLTGVQAVFSAVSVGTGVASGANGVGYTPQGTETALVASFLTAPLGAGSKPAYNQLMFGVTLDGAVQGWINEIGLFLSDGTLFALWSEDPTVVQSTTTGGAPIYGAPLGYKSAGVPYVLGALVTLSGVDLGNLTVTINGPLLTMVMSNPATCGRPADPVTEAGEAAVIGTTRAASDAEFAAGAPAAASLFKYPFPTLEQIKAALGAFLQPPPAGAAFYVDAAAGNDANAGTAAAPFKTLQGAESKIAATYITQGGVTVNVAAGAYAGLSIAASLVGTWTWTFAAGAMITQGAGGASNGRGVQIVNAVVTLNNPQFASTYNENISVSALSSVQIWGGVFKAPTQSSSGAIGVYNSSTVGLLGNMTYSGNAAYFVSVGNVASLAFGSNTPLLVQSLTLTLTGVPAFSSAFMLVGSLSEFTYTVGEVTFVGSATGKRYAGALTSIINTAGSGSSVLPGNAAGTVDATSVYA